MERVWEESVVIYFLTLHLFCYLPEKPVVAELLIFPAIYRA
jgi:hypothetical protein